MARPAGPPAATTTPRSTSSRSDTRRPLTHARPVPIPQARRLLPRPTSPEGLRVLRRQDRPDRLQGGQPPPPVPLRAREDRAAPEDGHVRRPPARAVRGAE